MWRFWAKKCIRDHLWSLWQSVVLVTVHRWQRSAAAEGRWRILTKCGLTKVVTVRRVDDGPSYRFVMKFREVIQYSYSKSWSVVERRPSTDRCAYDSPSYLPLRRMKREAEEIAKYGTTESMMVRRDTTVRREVRRPSRVLADFQKLESLFN